MDLPNIHLALRKLILTSLVNNWLKQVFSYGWDKTNISTLGKTSKIPNTK